MLPAPQATNHLGRRSFFSTTNEAQWLNIRKGTAQAFCHQNIRWDAPRQLLLGRPQPPRKQLSTCARA